MVVRELLTKLGFVVDNTGFKKYEDNFSKVMTTAKRAVATLGFLKLGQMFLKSAGEGEQTLLVMSQFIGSAEKAKKLLQDIGTFSIQTGFNKDEAEDYSKKLLAMGVAAENIIPTLKMVGDIGAGVGKDKMPLLVTAIGRMNQRGEVDSRTFNTLLMANIPILEVLQKQTGKTTQQLKKMGNEGSLSLSDMNKALSTLTSSGGKFDNLLMRNSKTFLGIVSRIQAFLNVIVEGIGTRLLPIAREFGTVIIDFLGGSFESIQEIAVNAFTIIAKVMALVFVIVEDLLAPFGGLAGIFKILGSTLKVVSSIWDGFVVGLGLMMNLLRPFKSILIALAIAWGIINLVMAASPLTWIILGVVALTTAVGFLVKNWEKVGKFFKKLWEDIWKGFAKFFKPIIDWIKMVWDKITQIVGGVGRFFGIGTPSDTMQNENLINKRTNSINFAPTTTINLQIPEGTPGAQKNALKDQAKMVFEKQNQERLRDLQLNSGMVEFGGVKFQ